MSNPYKSADAKAFWRKAVDENWNTNALLDCVPLLRSNDKFGSAGSCFAGNIIPYLESAGFEYVRKVHIPEELSDTYQENFNYHTFSAAYGNIYTARHFLQLLLRAKGEFCPKEDRWYVGSEVVDPFRPGLRYKAQNDVEFDALQNHFLKSLLCAIADMDVFVFTLGLTEAWVSSIDGAVFPACPGTITGKYDREKHHFKNFSASEITHDLLQAFDLLRSINPNLRVILTVSPVPLVATATDNHVLSATVYSKSVLRVAAQEVTNALPYVTYFPSYEIVTGPQAPQDYFESDRRSVSKKAIDAVMACLIENCETDAQKVTSIKTPLETNTKPEKSVIKGSSALVDLECEEAASDTD